MQVLLVLILVTPCIAASFRECKNRTLEILNGNFSYNGIDQGNIEQYLYKGPVYGMIHEYARLYRENYLTLNLQGNASEKLAKFSFH